MFSLKYSICIKYYTNICISGSCRVGNKSNTNFSHNITGLIEGDGTIYVPKPERSFNHKLNMEYVKGIKSGMNDKRTIFVFDHLENFYNF